jgi:hypothetical protein
LTAPAYSALRGGRGCLSATPPARAPRYRLNDAERSAIAAYLAAPDLARAPTVEARRALAHYRCNACHEVEAPALATFDHPPPSLADTGNKLRVSWLRDVLVEKTRMRHWLELRMPDFANAGGLAEGLAALAGAPREEPAPTPRPDALTLREGVRLLGRGEEGLACITCHDFAWYKSGAATPAPDLSTMGRRMRPEWFERWLRDPGRIQPGTQMPAFFAEVEPTVFDGKQKAMWAALSLGKDMPLPEGVSPDNRAVKLAPNGRPVVFRSFVTGGGERSVLVGLPGGQSFAFDVEQCRLQFAWSGEFIDVRPVWFERGGRPAVPLGDRYYVAAPAFPLRLGNPDAKHTPRFEGYALDKGGVPVFAYDVDGAKVRQRITPAPKAAGLQIALEVRGKDLRDVYYVPGDAGVDVTASGAAWDGQRAHARARGGVARFTITVRKRGLHAASPAPGR